MMYPPGFESVDEVALGLGLNLPLQDDATEIKPKRVYPPGFEVVGGAGLGLMLKENATEICYNKLDPLNCFLKNLVISPPPSLCFPVQDGIVMCLNDLVCNGVELEDIPSR